MDQNQNLYSDSILLVSYKKNSQTDSKDSFRVSLLTALKLKMFKYDVKTDVAVLSFASSTNGGIDYLPFVTKISSTGTFLNLWPISAIKKINELKTLDEIYTVGYPKSLSLTRNFDFNRPLVRKGIIAGLDFTTNKIIADCPTYQGNSGGIVILVFPVDMKYYIIGLVSQFVPFEEHWKNEAYGYSNTNVYNSGYSVIVPIDFILQQLSLLGK